MVRSPSVRVLRDRSTCSSRSGRWHATSAGTRAEVAAIRRRDAPYPARSNRIETQRGPRAPRTESAPAVLSVLSLNSVVVTAPLRTSEVSRSPGASAGGELLRTLLLDSRRATSVTHIQHVPARPGVQVDWPDWTSPLLVDRLRAIGVERPWAHQAAAAQTARSGSSVVLSTGTASGKSLGYLLPLLSTLLDEPGARALYLAPTKALARDQLAAVRRLALTGVRAAAYDGDTPREDRDWARAHASYVHTNPDMLSYALLPQHARWRRSCAACATSWSTSATTTAGCSVATSLRCCAGCGGSARSTGPRRWSCSLPRRWPTRAAPLAA